MREMKDSGVEWIGKIPIEWHIAKYKYFTENRMGETILKEDIISTGIPVYSATQTNTIFGYVKEANLILSKNDFVIPARGNSIGCVNIIYDNVATCTQTTICSKNIHNIYYLFLYFCCIGLKEKWYEYAGSAIPQITVEQVKNNLLPIPSISEQHYIADYLDNKCSKIDTIIEKQQTLIEKLKEYKMSLITEVVTKGLNPDVEMKDSEIQWISKIPMKWQKNKIKFCCKFSPNCDLSQFSKDTIVTFTPMEYIKNGYFINNREILSNLNGSYNVYLEDDIVIAKVTPCFENGNIAIMTGLYSGIGFGSSELFVIRPISINTKYLFYFLQNKIFKQMACSTMSGVGGLKRVSSSFVQNYIITVPPQEEQNEIADFLDKKCKAIENSIKKKQDIINKLTEYKKSLIYEVVTGKKEIN